MENVKKFYEALAQDEAMKKRAEALNEKHKGGKLDEAAARADIIAFAKTEGYSFTPEDLDAYAKQPGQLSDDELEAVAGGTYDKKKCKCLYTGSGTDTATGQTCSCTFGGMGEKDSEGWRLFCPEAGAVKNC